MSEELAEEITSINSIYGGGTISTVSDASSSLHSLVFPSQPGISLRIEFPLTYPDAPPSVLGTLAVGDDIAKGEGAYFVGLVRDVLAEIYTPGVPCIFDLVEEVGARLQQLGMDKDFESKEQQAVEAGGQENKSFLETNNASDLEQPVEALGEEPPWTLSEVVSIKKSVFVARSAPVDSIDQAKHYLAHLLATDKKVAKATHNITAWRIRGDNGVQYQDCDDDGETAAGSRVLHLLELMDVWDAMVVVTRWYGGVQLGPDRFRIINQTARDALVKGGFAQNATKGDKKKGKK